MVRRHETPAKNGLVSFKQHDFIILPTGVLCPTSNAGWVFVILLQDHRFAHTDLGYGRKTLHNS